MTSKGFRESFDSADSKQHEEVRTLLGVTLFCCFLPIVAGYAFSGFRLGEIPEITSFAKAGEFCLYSAAILAPAFFMIVHDRDRAPFPRRAQCASLAFCVLATSIILYTVSLPVGDGGIARFSSTAVAYGTTTIVLCWLTICFSYAIMVVDLTRSNPPVQAMQAAQEKSLSEKMNELP